jgi:hypothetical protein
MTLATTLGSNAWMNLHAAEVKALLPETWTHVQNVNLLRIGFELKLLGVDWRSNDELAKCMVYFEKAGLMRRDGVLVRRS